MRIVAAGATGFLGRPLVQTLLDAGHDVTVLTRRTRPDWDVRQVEWCPDGNAGPWSSVIDDADGVVNLAGESLASGRWTTRRKTVLLDSRILPTRSLSAAIAAAARPPRVFVSSSGTNYYGPHGDEVVTEADPPGHDFLAQLASAWEREAQAARSPTTRVVVLRSGPVLERGGGALGPMLLPFQLGLGGPLGSGRQYWSWIHRDDWVRLVIFLLEHASADGPVNATAPEPVTNAEFTQTLARVLRRPAIFRAPAFALRLAMGEMAEAMVLTGARVLPARALEMGFEFRYPALRPALEAIFRPRRDGLQSGHAAS